MTSFFNFFRSAPAKPVMIIQSPELKRLVGKTNLLISRLETEAAEHDRRAAVAKESGDERSLIIHSNLATEKRGLTTLLRDAITP